MHDCSLQGSDFGDQGSAMTVETTMFGFIFQGDFTITVKIHGKAEESRAGPQCHGLIGTHQPSNVGRSENLMAPDY